MKGEKRILLLGTIPYGHPRILLYLDTYAYLLIILNVLKSVRHQTSGQSEPVLELGVLFGRILGQWRLPDLNQQNAVIVKGVASRLDEVTMVIQAINKVFLDLRIP